MYSSFWKNIFESLYRPWCNTYPLRYQHAPLNPIGACVWNISKQQKKCEYFLTIENKNFERFEDETRIFLSPNHASRLNVAVAPLVGSVGRVQDPAQSHSTKSAPMHLFHVRHELSNIAIQTHVLLRLQLFQRLHETRNQCLEHIVENMALYASRSMADRSVRRAASAARGDYGPHHGARCRGRTSGPSTPATHEIGPEVCCVATLRSWDLRRLARASFLICHAENKVQFLELRVAMGSSVSR